MADIAKASLVLVPRIDRLEETINKQLKAAQKTSSKSGEGLGEGVVSGMGRGLAKSGAVMGVFAALTNTALSAVANHIDAATSRFDTLNNYPKMMQQMGYSSEVAENSIAKMSDRLQGLPTSLDAMASTVSGIDAVVEDLDKSTDAGLALNDMLIASRSNAQLTSAAMEQFRQMLAKGKPELQDWKSLTAAMPLQMKQLAQSLLGPTANANDLYTALGGGGAEATISMDQLLDKMIELDTNGTASFASFRDQAAATSGGVQTSMQNISTAFTRGLADTMSAIGSANIAGALGDVKGIVDGVFKTFNSGVSAVMPAVSSLYEMMKQMGSTAIAGAAGFAAFDKVRTTFSASNESAGAFVRTVRQVGSSIRTDITVNSQLAAQNGLGRLETKMLQVGTVGQRMGMTASSAIRSIVTPANLAAAGVTLASIAIAGLVQKYVEWKTQADNAEKATVGLSDAVANVTSLDDYRDTISSINDETGRSAMSMDELNQSFADHVDAINQSTAKAQEEIGQLNAAQSIISQYAGATDLSAQAQGRLQWALELVNEQFGLSLTAADAAANKYTDQNGHVQELSSSIDALIETKRREIEMDALASSYSEMLAAKSEAADTYASALQNADTRLEELIQQEMLQGVPAAQAEAAAQSELNRELEEKKQALDNAAAGAEAVATEMGDLAASTSESADEFDKWALSADDSMGGLLSSLLRDKGTISAFKDDLRDLGASTADLSQLSSNQIQQLALAYDGSMTSIVGLLQEYGVGLDEAKAKAAAAASDIKKSFDDMNVTGSLESAGVSVSDFAQKLAEAGVSTEQLSSIGSDNLSNLASACQGNMNMMVWAITHYNDTPVLDKDGNIQVDQAELIDAQGNVYTWNGTELVEKSSGASVDYAEVVDGTGAILVWDGTELASKDSTAEVSGNAVNGQASSGVDSTSGAIRALSGKTVSVNAVGNYETAASSIWNLGSAIGGLMNKTVSVVANVGAKLGIQQYATGGIRKHADGFIATGPTMITSNDMIGEAGAEAYFSAGGNDYIVPLTNKRYAQPFIDLLAEGLSDKSRSGGNVYSFGDINIKAEQLRDLQTIDELVNMIIRAKGAR